MAKFIVERNKVFKKSIQSKVILETRSKVVALKAAESLVTSFYEKKELLACWQYKNNFVIVRSKSTGLIIVA